MNWKTACKIAAPAAACAGAFAFLVAPGRATRAQKAPFLCRNYAHRGLHTEDGSVPENSLPAFRAAAEAGYAVEMDVHLTADDRLVVFHDDTLERMCGVQGVIDDFTLAELRALMGANLHRRNLSPFDMARQLETLREVLKNEDKLPANIKEQSELMAEQTDLSRATVERYLDLLNLDETLTVWAESGKMTMTDAYELARRSNAHLYPAVEEFVAMAGETDDFPVLVHRAIAYAKAAELPPAPPKAAPNALRSVDSFGRAIRRSTAQLRTLKLDDADKATAKRKLDTCLANLDELRRTVEALKNSLD